MKKLFAIIIGLFMVCGISFAQNDGSGDILMTGDDMPSFVIKKDNGQTISSSSFKGKVVLITLFATWCPPCQKELAFVKKTLWPKYKDNKDFELLVIGREHNDAELAKYNETKGFEFKLYPDKDRAIFSKFAETAIPRSYLIGKDGKVVFQTKGYTAEEGEALMAEIEKALSAK
jgi:peroxiredoxin